jgi:carbonic anhydrase
VGNLVPPCGKDGFSVSDESEIAAIEFSLSVLRVSDMIVCGHSECGAIGALVKGRSSVQPPHFQAWLRHAEPTLEMLAQGKAPDPQLLRHNQVSQLNVLLQLEHLMSYPIVADRVKAGKLRLHGWWFELHHADVYFYDPNRKKFILITEKEAEFILSQL